MRLSRLAIAALVALAACEDILGPGGDPDAPANLTYQLTPSGNPDAPLAVLLTWDVPASGRAASFNVYGRTGPGAAWQLRATTTSPTFHDAGVPDLEYYVATRDDQGDELGRSNVVTIDLHATVPAPLGLHTISLNAAIQLAWNSNAVDALHGAFDHYRVYSTSYDGTRGVCTSSWVLEGTTASDGFLAANLVNGASRCFAVSTVTREGHESPWSEAHLDTPRFDARNALVYSTAARTDSAGFLFLDESSHALGVVVASARPDLDFTIERRADGSLWITPGRSGSTLALYSTQPVVELTSIDRAPASGFGTGALQARPGFGYVFKLQKADGVHFAALRVAFLAADYVVFDWAYQSGIGNPELSRAGTGGVRAD
jgi:hypothetical protein